MDGMYLEDNFWLEGHSGVFKEYFVYNLVAIYHHKLVGLPWKAFFSKGPKSSEIRLHGTSNTQKL